MSRNKLISLSEAVRRYTWDGMQYASGAALPVGSDAIVFGRELLRQKRRNLHSIFHCNTQQLNLLAAAGATTHAECGFTGLEVFALPTACAEPWRAAISRSKTIPTSRWRCASSAVPCACPSYPRR